MSDPVLPREFCQRLADTLGPTRFLLDPADRWAYAYDNSRQQRLPGAVALPKSTAEVAAILTACDEFNVAVCPRGLGTGTTGGSIPPDGGLALSLERMDRIINVDPANRVAVVEAGTINLDLQNAVARHGFFWPPDPTSAGYSTIGGNLACNAAGPRTLKYGTPRENTLGLVAVTASGEIVRCGCYTTKGVVGYDLTRLLIGSEGTLAVITEATLLLTPVAPAVKTLRASFRNVSDAAAAVSRIMSQPVTPRSIEFMDNGAIQAIRSQHPFPAATGALLLIDVDGTPGQIDEATAAVSAAASGDGLVGIESGDDPEEAKALWDARKALSPSLRRLAPGKINEDVVVPVSRIPKLVDGLADLERLHGLQIVSFGHAGNGNIHVNILYDPADEAQARAAGLCLASVFELTLSLGGSLSGEHGIGLVKRRFVEMEIGAAELGLMRAIKQQLDPKGILNPGKLFPDPTPGA